MKREENQAKKNYLKLGQQIPTKEKLCFGIGVSANSLFAGIVNLYLTDYYLNKMMIRYDLFIICNVIFMIYNALNDVFFGHYADNVKHRLGRRIPFIRYGAPIFAISFIYFWFPLPGTFPGDLDNGQWMKFFQLLTGYLFFDTMLTIVILSVVSLPPEMTESTEERTSLSLYNTLFGLIGGISIIAVPALMSLGLDIFRFFIILVGIGGTIAYLILSYGVKERKDLSQNVEDVSKKENILKEMFIAFKSKPFISFLIFNFCVFYEMTMVQAFTPFFTNIFGLNNDGMSVISIFGLNLSLANSTLVLAVFYLGNGLGILIFVLLSNKMDTRAIIMYGIFICFVGISILFLIDLLFNFNGLYWFIFIFNGILMGLFFLHYPYISDALDIDELNTGRRREGIHFGINAMIQKPGEQLPVIFGALILLVVGYIQGGAASVQSETAIFGLKLMVTIIPIILCVIVLLSQLINPLKGEYLKDIKIKIMDLHEKKEGKK